MTVLVALILGASRVSAAPPAQLPADIDIPYAGSGTLALGGAELTLQGRTILRPDGAVLTEKLYTAPVADGAHLCAADEGADGLGRLRCWNTSLQPVTLQIGGRPGRLAIGPGWLAWVASPAGLPQVFVAPANASAPPRALTNVGLDYTPGRAPEGFVPPPLRSSLRFDGDFLRWDTAEGPRSVRWR
jgi:hypothetical protein